MSRLTSAWKMLAAFLGLVALSLSGCARSAVVSGTVKYQGKLLTSGYVIFVDEANRASPPVSIQSDGAYLGPSVPIGPLRILIIVPPPSAPETAEKDSQEFKDFEAKLATLVAIPTRYADLELSGLTFEVKNGNNAYDIELD